MSTTPKPPAHLTPTSKALWRRLHEDHAIDDAAGLALLQSLCEAHDRLQQARAILAEAGPVFTDRNGHPRAHPANGIERDARTQLHSAMRLLRLSPGDVS